MAPAAGLHSRHHGDDRGSTMVLHTAHSNSAGELLAVGSPLAHLRQRRSQGGSTDSRQQQPGAGPWPPSKAAAGTTAAAAAAAGGSSGTGRAWKQWQLLAACLAWVVASSGAILINKHILVDLSFPYPGTIGSLGMVGTSLICWVTVSVLQLVPATQRVTSSFFMLHIMPAGLFLALAMQLGNTAYLYLSVAFIQMLKAFTPVATMLFGFLFRLEQPSVRLVAAVGLIACGVGAASYGEGHLSIAGVVAMLGSVFCEGLRLVLMQFLVAKKAFHPLEALMYLAPAASFWTLLIATTSEWVHIAQSADHAGELLTEQWHVLAGSAAAGFAVNAAAMAVVSRSSALSLKVLGLVKDVGLVLWGVAAMGESVSRLQVVGYGVSVAGFAWYHFIKARQAALGLARPAVAAAPRGSVSGAFTAAVEPRPPSRAALAASASALAAAAAPRG